MESYGGIQRDSKVGDEVAMSELLNVENLSPVQKTSLLFWFRQYTAALLICLLSMSCSIDLAWVTAVQELLLTKETPLKRPLSLYEVSLMFVVPAFGVLLSSLFTATLSDKLPRKPVLLVAAVTLWICWLPPLLSSSFTLILGARAIMGFAIQWCQVMSVLYLSEVAKPAIRGSMTIFIVIGFDSGFVYALGMGTRFSYHTYTALCMLPSILFVIFFCFFPESPLFLVKRERRLSAVKSFVWFNGEASQLNDYEVLGAQQNSRFRDLFLIRANRRSLEMCLVIFSGVSLCGALQVFSFIEVIIKDAGIRSHVNHLSVIIATLKTVCSYLCVTFVDRVGRKVLISISHMTMIVGGLLLSLHFWLLLKQDSYPSQQVLSVSALTLFIAGFSVGNSFVPFVFLSEIFTPRSRGAGTTIAMIFNSLLTSLTTPLYVFLVLNFNYSITFLLYSGCSLFTLIFVWLRVPETRGLSSRQVLEKLSK